MQKLPQSCPGQRGVMTRQYVQKYHTLLLAAICSILFFTTSYIYVQLLATPSSGDEPHFLIISQTLLKYHSLNVMLDYQHGDYRVFYPLYIAPHVAYNARGQLLPLHNIGGPVLWLLPYYFWGRLGAVLFISLLSVLIILNIYKFLLTMHISQRYAFIVSLAYAVASPLYIYSHLTFIEPIGAFICIYVFRKIFQKEMRVSEIIISSILLGILPWIHIRFALFEMILFFSLLYKIYATNRLNNFKYYLYYIAPITILFIALEVYNYQIWGTLNPAVNEVNDIHGGSTPFAVLPFAGILGVFFDQEHGLFVNFPVFMLLLTGMVLAARRKFLRYNLLMLLLSIPYILLFTSFKDWAGGWCPPARFILVLLPLSSFYLAYTLEQINSILSGLILGITMLYGCIYNILSVMPFLSSFNGGEGRNRALLRIQVFNHRLTDFLPSLFLPNQTRLFGAWIGLCISLSLMLIFVSRHHADDHSPLD